MMLDDLSLLLDYVNDHNAFRGEYREAIEKDNCLGKRSGKTRTLSVRHLGALYALDKNVTLFRSLRYFWERDPAGRPLIALLCTHARDSFFRLSVPFIFAFEHGEVVSRKALERFLERQHPHRFSEATLKSTAQNINSTWTQAGHLTGKRDKTRSKAQTTPGSVSYALLLAFLSGSRGEGLFQSDYAKLLDCSKDEAIPLAETASRRGWIVFKRVDDVIEVAFPSLLNAQELEWIREQN